MTTKLSLENSQNMFVRTTYHFHQKAANANISDLKNSKLPLSITPHRMCPKSTLAVCSPGVSSPPPASPNPNNNSAKSHEEARARDLREPKQRRRRRRGFVACSSLRQELTLPFIFIWGLIPTLAVAKCSRTPWCS